MRARIFAVLVVLTGSVFGCASTSPDRTAARPVVEEGDLLDACIQASSRYFPEQDISAANQRLDAMVADLNGRLRRDRSARQIVESINQYFYDEQGFVPRPEASVPSYLLPDRVLAGKQGNCVGLAIVYLALSQRLRVPLFAETLLEHIFLRYDNGITAFDIETTLGGHITDESYYYREFLSGAPPYPDVYLRRLSQREIIGVYLLDVGVSLAISGRNTDALEAWTQAGEYCPRHPAIYLNLGKMYAQLDDKERAEQMLLKAIELDPNGWQAYHRLSGVHWAQRQVQPAIDREMEAIERISLALALQPQELGPLVSRLPVSPAEAWLDARATAALQDPTPDNDTLLALGITAFDRKRYELAGNLFDRALAASPRSPYLHICQAASCFQRGLYAPAIEHSRIADASYGTSGHPRRFGLALNTLIECYRNAGTLYLIQRNLDRASEMANKAMEIGGPSAHSYDTLAYVHLFRGELDEARTLFGEALKLDPTFKTSLDGLAQMNARQQ